MSSHTHVLHSLHRGDGAKRSTGFTLLELLLVLTLTSLLLTLVPASFSSMLPYLEQRAEVRRFVTTLNKARGTAIRERREVTVFLDLRSQDYRLKNSKETVRISEAFTIEYEPTAFGLTHTQPKVVAIHFFADGSSNGARFRFNTEQQRYHIDVNWLTGKVDYNETVSNR